MYLAMNRFKVALDQGEVFEKVWSERDSKLPQMEGFIDFKLLRGPELECHRLYASHVFWKSEENFRAWTSSDQFKKAHSKSKMPKGVILGPPNFEGFEVAF